MGDKLKPLFVVKPKTMTRRDINRAEKHAGIIVVECEDPEQARFLEPPIDAEIDVQARGALDLMRVVASGTTINYSRDWLVTWFVNALMRERRPEPVKRIEKVQR